MTFRKIQINLDASLISYRARILHNQGLAPSSIANRLKIPTGRVKQYLEGVYCTAKTPSLPSRLCPTRSKFWGIPVFQYSGSQERLNINSQFHRDSYIPSPKGK